MSQMLKVGVRFQVLRTKRFIGFGYPAISIQPKSMSVFACVISGKQMFFSLGISGLG